MSWASCRSLRAISHLPEQAGARAAARGCPGGWSVGSAGLFSDVVGQVGNELGTLGEIVAPDRIDLQSDWDAGQPRQRPVISCRSLRKSPVHDGGDVVSGGEISPECGFIEVDERVFAGLGGKVDEVGSQGGPGRFVGDVGYDLVDRLSRWQQLGSDELLRGGLKAIGVALDRIVQPGRRITELAQEASWRRWANRRGPGSVQGLGRGAGRDGLGSDDGCAGRRRRRPAGRGDLRSGRG